MIEIIICLLVFVGIVFGYIKWHNYVLDRDHKKWMAEKAKGFERFCDALERQSKIEEMLFEYKLKQLSEKRIVSVEKTKADPPISGYAHPMVGCISAALDMVKTINSIKNKKKMI